MLLDSTLGSWQQARAEDALGSSSIVTFAGCGPAELSSLMLQGPGWTLELSAPPKSELSSTMEVTAPMSTSHPCRLRRSGDCC